MTISADDANQTTVPAARGSDEASPEHAADLLRAMSRGPSPEQAAEFPSAGSREPSPEQAAELLRAGVPVVGWRRLDLVVRMLRVVEEYQLTVLMPDGSTPAFDPPPGLAPVFRALRRRAFVPGVGTWYSARLTLDSEWDAVGVPGFVYTENFEADPGWTPPLPIEVYLDDLGAVFGDAELRVPPWLAGILGTDMDR